MSKEEIVSTLWQFGRSFCWAMVAAISFALAMGVAIKVFDVLSRGIDEWEEIKKGNWGVAIILASMIISVGLVLYKVI